MDGLRVLELLKGQLQEMFPSQFPHTARPWSLFPGTLGIPGARFPSTLPSICSISFNCQSNCAKVAYEPILEMRSGVHRNEFPKLTELGLELRAL